MERALEGHREKERRKKEGEGRKEGREGGGGITTILEKVDAAASNGAQWT